jgi:hypothetical protein
VSGLSERQLAEIRAREAAATAGPWGVYDDGTARLDIVAGLELTGTGYTGRREIAQTVESPMDNDRTHVAWGEDEDDEQTRADGVFIAAARSDVPALLAEVERLRSLLHDVQRIARDRMAEAKGRKAHGEHLAARVAELESERHSTNESLDDAVSALRGKAQRIVELEREVTAAKAERDIEIVVWLGKKAREYRSTGGARHALQADAVEVMASTIARGAVAKAGESL